MSNQLRVRRREEPPPGNAWVRPGVGSEGALVRLFCFAHAGGGPAFFRDWGAVLLPEIEVCRVLLPGRDARLREPPFTRMAELIGPLFEALLPYMDKPFAFFGHSMGSAIAYELARVLRTRGLGGPLRLIVSGRRAPHLPARRRPFFNLPDTAFLAALRGMNGTPSEVLQDGELLKLFLPALRADFELIETYVPESGALLTCPVSAFAGDSDPEVDRSELSAWRHITSGEFRSRLFSGDHFYLKGAPQHLLVEIRDELRQDLTLRSWMVAGA